MIAFDMGSELLRPGCSSLKLQHAFWKFPVLLNQTRYIYIYHCLLDIAAVCMSSWPTDWSGRISTVEMLNSDATSFSYQLSSCKIKVAIFMHHTACTLQQYSWVLHNQQYSQTAACALLSVELLIQALSQVLQLHSWGFTLIQCFQNNQGRSHRSGMNFLQQQTVCT